MSRKPREIPEEVEAKEPEFTADEVTQIVAHAVKSGLLHLPPKFRAEKSEDSDESE